MTNKRRQATAVTYNQELDYAPKISAQGKGHIAENIIHTAQEKGVPILEDPTLVELLSQLNINDTIPPELFEAVAEVFAFIYHVDQMEEK